MQEEGSLTVKWKDRIFEFMKKREIKRKLGGLEHTRKERKDRNKWKLLTSTSLG